MTITGMPRPRFGLPEAGKDKIPQLHTYFLTKSWLKRQKSASSRSGNAWNYCCIKTKYNICCSIMWWMKSTCTLWESHERSWSGPRLRIPIQYIRKFLPELSCKNISRTGIEPVTDGWMYITSTVRRSTNWAITRRYRVSVNYNLSNSV